MRYFAKTAIFDDIYITSDTSRNYITNPPSQWDSLTLFWAQFNGNLLAGNASAELLEQLEQTSAIRIKKRKVDDFIWTTIAEYNLTDINNIAFSLNDVTGENNVVYEYAWVPVLNNGSEGEYTISQITSHFRGVILADKDTSYRLMADVQYGSVSRQQQVGTYEPYGRKYPIVVSNGDINYEQGSLSAKVLGATYNATDIFRQSSATAKEIVADKKLLMDFLTNKKAKILKDTQGNIWLICITDAPTVNYYSNTGNTMLDISCNWTEIGDATNTQDVVNSGLVGGAL